MMPAASRLVLVSGLSGSGKSVALRALEDNGFFAVDNLPATLIPALIENHAQAQGKVPHIAVAIDARSIDTISAIPHVMQAMGRRGIDCRILYLDATEDTIARRFAETRRPHPLAGKVAGGIEACIREERRLLVEVANAAHRIDTSSLNANTLRNWIREWLSMDSTRLALTFQSFGFKHGIPIDADFVFDARVLPNPYYDPKLRSLSGRDGAVREFLEADLNVARMIEDIATFLHRWLPLFASEGRSSVNVSIGCTGGQHRSVYVVEELARRLGSDEQVLVRHRDLS
jgi:UPF0042 nucleotide-binding protein